MKVRCGYCKEVHSTFEEVAACGGKERKVNKWEHESFSTRQEAVAHQVAQKRGYVKPQGEKFVWFALKESVTA